MPKRVYISGAMTGVEDFAQNFDRAKEKLTKLGYKIINPACMDDVMPNADYEEYMIADMFLLDMCDAIYMVKGWEKSCGANREYGYALAKGLEIMVEGK